MNRETVIYIINYFRNLMSIDEKLTLKYKMMECPELEEDIAKRIMKETPDKVFFNNCSKCGKLARTPFAKQCRYCGYSWHSEQII
ncbi:hypothetical protein MKJ01_17975 [Chryseobacterium sp. SSA4.19]|uniref:hypothetical protein n=1 Tax=Chryseobacterium sp. SSA4.19 TaxID=2919915 RepID=UPI001F4E221B|nr:hypothetical protein [Chryseobacterium sp. SSA4.19]MCJ8155648.1 hypothetical protein [Chryseobacterium sp. SSA4.19]